MSVLRDIIVGETNRPTFAAANTFARHLADSLGPSVAAVVFYGSCLRQSTDQGLMLDFYVLVDRMSAAIKNPLSAAFGAALPPNVYYRELAHEGRTLRAKVAVMSMARFMRDTGPGCFASSLWARFSQPAIVLMARNDVVRGRVQDALAQAVNTMIAAAQPLMPARFTARELWVQALSATYGAELRPESVSKAAELVDSDLARYIAVTEAVLGAPLSDAHYANTSDRTPGWANLIWNLRRAQGKTLNVLRLIKAAFTFQGGLDYAVWKIERHSGVKLELTEAERHSPIITGLKLLPRLLKIGGVR
ncbi:MAG: hypothetical protein EXR11_00645 [Rhodospirillaceae bacterium]|nr:hypothetical protein [Rhodospirillaceae bacterium]